MLFHTLNTMINGENQSFQLRLSILYFLQSYLYKNNSGKSKIVDTVSIEGEND
jgi:hypothetical protein